jgi:hypothetical protein
MRRHGTAETLGVTARLHLADHDAAARRVDRDEVELTAQLTGDSASCGRSARTRRSQQVPGRELLAERDPWGAGAQRRPARPVRGQRCTVVVSMRRTLRPGRAHFGSDRRTGLWTNPASSITARVR